METEETVKEECVAVSKTKRIWLAFVDIVLFTVLFVIFLFLFAIPFAIAWPVGLLPLVWCWASGSFLFRAWACL